ncbi:MAG: hypothetical protein RIQ93_119 [Verrucomicrobiota bacterium]|jgi:hypothetical protein
MKRFLLPLAFVSVVLNAAPPPELARALQQLRDQGSYSWEVINGDPGPVAQNFETRRGTVTTVQQNTSPNIKGSVDAAGDTLISRQWEDGVRLDTLIATTGAMVTNTPDGWLTNHEILTLQAAERMAEGGPTARYVWLRRADRPDVRRPDQELSPLLKTGAKFEAVSADTYVVTGNSVGDDSQHPYDVAITIHLRGGVIRDYEISIEGSRAVTRARVKVPIKEHRIVILTYVPVARLDVPPEAREKLKAVKSRGR